MTNRWKESIGFGNNGIPGITHALDDSSNLIDNSLVAYDSNGQSKSDQGRIKDVLTAPFDLIGVGAQAIVGGTALWLGRKVGIADPSIEIKNETKKRKIRREKLIHELEGTANWTKAIKTTVENSQQLRNNPNRISSLAASTFGKKGMEIIDNSLKVNQNTPAEVKPVQDDEISLAQRILATVDSYQSIEKELDTEINRLSLENIKKIGERRVDSFEVSKLRELKQQKDIKVTAVSWWEGILAAISGATGRKKDSIRGGYEVTVNDGILSLRIGEDNNQIAPPEQVTVDYDIPRLYEATFSVADQKVPLLKGKFSNWIKNMTGIDSEGNVPLFPGRIDIGLTGSEEKISFPALHVRIHQERINRIKAAGIILNTRLKSLENTPGDTDQLRQELQQEAIKVAQNIPRKKVVIDILSKIPVPISDHIASVSDNNDSSNQKIENQVSQTVLIRPVIIKPTPSRDLSNSEKILQSVNLLNMDKKTAEVIIRQRENMEKYWIEKYGQKKGRNITQIVERRARSVLKKNI